VPRDPEIVVIGSGPNGLVAACVLALQGYSVLVLESNPQRPGGAMGSAGLTLPGFVHDLGAAFFPWGTTSPAFVELGLEALGVEWCHTTFESCHPAPDGSAASIARDPELTARNFGNSQDGDRWRELANFHAELEPRLLEAALGPPPALGAWWRLGVRNLLRLARMFSRSTRGLANSLFRSEAARRVFPGLALHSDVAPDDAFGAAMGYFLGLLASTGGFAVPRGGAQRVVDALLTRLEREGGRLTLGAWVDRIIVREGRAVAVRLENGVEIPARAVLADTAAPHLLLHLIEEPHVPAWVRRKMQKYPHAWGTFKLDWALSSPVPWRVEAARDSAVVHLGDDVDDLARFAREVRAGKVPERPYLVVGQQSLADPSRVPLRHQTLYAYTHVPGRIEGEWSEDAKRRFADAVEERIEEQAPGFKRKILGRHLMAPCDLEFLDANLVGGDLGGGTSAWHHQLAFRPFFPYFRYRMPVPGVYLCSSYAHPGGGAHGMCGYNAAQAVARDLG